MPKMPVTRENQAQFEPIRGCHNLAVPLGSGRGDHRGYSMLRKQLETIRKREKGVRGGDRSLQTMAMLPGLADRQLSRIDPAGLPAARRQQQTLRHEDNRIGLHMGAQQPGRLQILKLRRRRFAPGRPRGAPRG